MIRNQFVGKIEVFFYGLKRFFPDLCLGLDVPFRFNQAFVFLFILNLTNTK